MINKIFLCLNSSAHSDCSLRTIFQLSSPFFLHLSSIRRKSGDNSGSRQIRNTPDWSENAVSGDHLWVPTSVSGDCCYVGDSDCTVSFAVVQNKLVISRSYIYMRKIPNLHKAEDVENQSALKAAWDSAHLAGRRATSKTKKFNIRETRDNLSWK